MGFGSAVAERGGWSLLLSWGSHRVEHVGGRAVVQLGEARRTETRTTHTSSGVDRRDEQPSIPVVVVRSTGGYEAEVDRILNSHKLPGKV